MKIFAFFVLLSGIFSCTGNGPGATNQLAGSDSLVINFNTPQTNNIEKTLTTTENKAIKKLAAYVDGKAAEVYKCGYNGNLLFYKKGIITGDVSFNYTAGCRHFLQSVEGKLASTSMSNEAADFLKGLAEGRDWY
ncbi:MAG: hypothetical protein ABIT05_14190 [Chitinophagaceae bacterium]